MLFLQEVCDCPFPPSAAGIPLSYVVKEDRQSRVCVLSLGEHR